MHERYSCLNAILSSGDSIMSYGTIIVLQDILYAKEREQHASGSCIFSNFDLMLRERDRVKTKFLKGTIYMATVTESYLSLSVL